MKHRQKKQTPILRIIICIILAIASICLLAVFSFLFIFRRELKTLNSLQPKAPIGMYRMEYYSDYHFDEFLDIGITSDEAFLDFLTRRLTRGIVTDYESIPTLCSSFVCKNEAGEVLFARNFDYSHSPVAILTTEPASGYRCIMASNLALVGYNERKLPNANSFVEKMFDFVNIALLATPYWGTDGMNEHGLAMCILNSGTANQPKNENHPSLNPPAMVRMVLEQAKTVEEAVALMRQYNLYLSWRNPTPVHFMIADATGRSVAVEYYQGELVTVDTPIVTNYDLFSRRHQGIGHERYRIIEERLSKANGILSEEAALSLLADVVMPGMEQYSVLYNLTTGEVQAFTRGDASVVETFRLPRE